MFHWFSNLRVRWKILFAPGLIILVLIGVGAYSLGEQRAHRAADAAMMAGPVRQAVAVGEFSSSAWVTQVHLYRLMATAANESDANKVKALADTATKSLAAMVEKLNALEDPAFNKAGTQEKIAQLKAMVADYLKRAANVIEMADGDSGTALVFMMGAANSFLTIEKLTADLIMLSRSLRDQEISSNNAKLDREQTVLIVLLGVAVIGGGLVSFAIGQGIAKPISALVPELRKLADGDFNLHLAGLGRRDEVGQISAAIDMVAERVSATIANIKESANEVTNASAEISTSTTDLSQRTEEQAASLEETSASMQAMTETVKKNADNARQASELAGATREIADQGGLVAAKTVDAMAKIEESSRNISDIIGVIDEIARQTNLLALNAAVEAARAGEAGRGFAVVASEVRSLAQRSSQAAKDIKDLILNSNVQVKDGVELVNKAGESLHAIVESIKKVTAVVAEIANASTEQSTGIEQINKALNQMDEVTQQNSALVEENAATAKTLESQAKSMDDRVAFFRLRSGAPIGHPAPVAVAAYVAPNGVVKTAATRRVPATRMQAGLATALRQEPDWKEF
jgi:methyl-accepting chemotaxis protein